MLITHILFSLFHLIAAAVATDLGVSFEKDKTLPLLRLPYGTWRASDYNEEADTFRNIRYAAPPTGTLRWAKPAVPEFTPGIQNGSYGHNCIPIVLPGAEEDPMFENITKNAAEDCLFLDAYVPRKALKRKASLPVVVWIHGGGFTTGSKDMALGLGYYDGTGLVQAADHDIIVVTINYRLGGFGFLAGEPVKRNGTFHAGLHDQRAALAWVQSYISLLGGDPNNVSAWGQSAGGASIMYHLVAEGGTLDPLFKRAFVQSPGVGSGADLKIQYGRFENFSTLAGCGDAGDDVMDCLRSVGVDVLTDVNMKVFEWEASPVPDGDYIRHTMDAELARGNHWKSLDSLMISHVIDEASILVPKPLTPGYLETWIYFQFPSEAYHLAERMIEFYKERYPNTTDVEMATVMTRDLTITCHLRILAQSYPNITWATQYSYMDGVFNGVHASESVAQWYNPHISNLTDPLFTEYQRYITNHAQKGNPNLPRSKPRLPQWPRATGIDSELMGNVLNLDNEGFSLIEDDQLLESTCGTWRDLLVEASKLASD